MKKALFFLLILTSFGCKKNSEVTTETLSGKWSTGGYSLILYSSSGAEVSHLIADAIKSYWTFSGNQIEITNVANANKTTLQYKVFTTLNERKLVIENTANSTITTWKIEKEDANVIQLSTEIKDKAALTYGNGLQAKKGKQFMSLSRE